VLRILVLFSDIMTIRVFINLTDDKVRVYGLKRYDALRPVPVTIKARVPKWMINIWEDSSLKSFVFVCVKTSHRFSKIPEFVRESLLRNVKNIVLVYDT